MNDQVYPVDAFAPVMKQLGRQLIEKVVTKQLGGELIEEKVVAAVSMPSRDQ